MFMEWGTPALLSVCKEVSSWNSRYFVKTTSTINIPEVTRHWNSMTTPFVHFNCLMHPLNVTSAYIVNIPICNTLESWAICLLKTCCAPIHVRIHTRHELQVVEVCKMLVNGPKQNVAIHSNQVPFRGWDAFSFVFLLWNHLRCECQCTCICLLYTSNLWNICKFFMFCDGLADCSSHVCCSSLDQPCSHGGNSVW